MQTSLCGSYTYIEYTFDVTLTKFIYMLTCFNFMWT